MKTNRVFRYMIDHILKTPAREFHYLLIFNLKFKQKIPEMSNYTTQSKSDSSKKQGYQNCVSPIDIRPLKITEESKSEQDSDNSQLILESISRTSTPKSSLLNVCQYEEQGRVIYVKNANSSRISAADDDLLIISSSTRYHQNFNVLAEKCFEEKRKSMESPTVLKNIALKKIKSKEKLQLLKNAEIQIKINDLKMKKNELQNQERVAAKDIQISGFELTNRIEEISSELEKIQSDRYICQEIVNEYEKRMNIAEIEAKGIFYKQQQSVERQLNNISKKRLGIHDEIKFLQNEIRRFQDQQMMLDEDLRGRITRKIEMVAVREECEELLSKFEQENDMEMKILIEKQRTENQISECERLLSIREDTILNIENDIKTITKEISKYDRKHSSLKKKVTAGLRARDDELKAIKNDVDIVVRKIEEVTGHDTKEFINYQDNNPNNSIDTISGQSSLRSCEGRGSVFLHIVKSIGKGIEIDALKEQLSMVEKERELFRASFNRKIIEFRRNITVEEDDFDDVDTKTEYYKEQYNRKLSALDTWSYNLQSIIQENIEDNSYKEAYRLYKIGELKSYLSNQGKGRAYNKLLENLISLLEEYEEIAGQKSKLFVAEKEAMENCEMKILELDSQKETCLFYIEKAKDQIEMIIKEKKSLKEECSENKSLLEAHLCSRADERFKQIEKKEAQYFKNVYRTYGSKKLEQAKLAKRTELLEELLLQKKDKFKRIYTVQQKIQSINEKISISNFEESFQSELSEINKRIEAFTNKIDSLKSLEQELIEDEEKCIRESSDLQYAQQEKIKHALSQIIDSKYTRERARLDELNIITREKTDVIDSLKLELHEYEKIHQAIKIQLGKIEVEISDLLKLVQLAENQTKHQVSRIKGKLGSIELLREELKIETGRKLNQSKQKSSARFSNLEEEVFTERMIRDRLKANYGKNFEQALRRRGALDKGENDQSVLLQKSSNKFNEPSYRLEKYTPGVLKAYVSTEASTLFRKNSTASSKENKSITKSRLKKLKSGSSIENTSSIKNGCLGKSFEKHKSFGKSISKKSSKGKNSYYEKYLERVKNDRSTSKASIQKGRPKSKGRKAINGLFENFVNKRRNRSLDHQEQTVSESVNVKLSNQFLDNTFSSLYKKARMSFRSSMSGIQGFASSASGRRTNSICLKKCARPQECKKHRKYYKIDASKTSTEEMEIFQSLRPLLEGTHFYKKFTSSSLRRGDFDPRTAEGKRPEQCGYGLRFLRLNIFSRKLEIMNSNRQVAEKAIELSKIIRLNTKEFDKLRKEGLGCIEMVPFEIITEEGPLKMVSFCNSEFMEWVNGLNSLISQQSKVERVIGKVKCFCV